MNACKFHSSDLSVMSVFLLPKDVRCSLLCFLLGAVKLERDRNEVYIFLALLTYFFKLVNYMNNRQTELCLAVL